MTILCVARAQARVAHAMAAQRAFIVYVCMYVYIYTMSRQSCRLRVGKRTRGGRRAVSATLIRRAFTRNQMTWHLDNYRCSAEVRVSVQEIVPRKTAENTAKHRDGDVDSVVANHDGCESLVVVTTLTWCIHGRNRCVRKGVVHFECTFQGKGASLTNGCWRQKTKVLGLLLGIVCMILGFAP